MLVTASVRFVQSTDQMEGEQRALETGNSVPPAPEGEGAKQAKALDSITDHVEEKQLDAERTREAMAALSGRTRDADREKEERERELAKVRIADEDVKIIANEFEVRYSADAALSHAFSSDGGPRSLPSCREEVSLQQRSDARACGPPQHYVSYVFNCALTMIKIDQKAAEVLLREHKGSCEAALTALVVEE